MTSIHTPAVDADVFPVSFTQQRLWFLDRMEGGSAAYGITGALRLAGPLDAGALRRALEEAVHRHESLRTTFAVQDGEPVQVIHPPAEFELPVAELTDADEAALRARLDAEARRPFDLAAGPLFRALLLRVRPDEHVLVLSMHHVISDGWSRGVLFRELSALYGAFVRGEPSPLGEPPLQYADYAVWQRETLQGPAMERHLAWWRGQLAGAPALLELPTDRPRPPALSFRGGIERVRLPAGTVAALAALARGEGASLFMAVLALWQALLSKYSGQDDVVVGTPIAGRTRAELEGVIGFFANTLALRGDLSGDPSFRALLGRVREATFGAYTHQEVPFEQVVEEVHTGRSLGHNPLFQAFLALQNASDDALRLDGLAVSSIELESGSAKFDVSLLLREADGEIYGWLEYATDLFDASTIARMRRHLGVLADAVAADPDRPLSRIPLLPDDERETVVREWNATDAALPGPQTIHGSFEAQAARTPDRIALAFEGERVTYAELDARANQLARHLKRLGVGPEVRVGLCLERGTEMVVALLGVMKAGGAYVPLDPEYPADRLAYMLEDSGVGVLLTQAALRGILPPHTATVVELDAGWDAVAAESAELIEGGATPHTLAYVIYTSGSTGRPKGVMNAHHAVCNRLRWMLEWGGVRRDDRVLQKTPYSFDVSVWEFFCPLLCGATLVVARPGGHRHPSYLADLIQAERITVAHFVPSMLQLFLDEPGLEERCASLRLVGCSGEALPPALQERFLARMNAELHNLYGPTEAAVEVTHWVCRHEPGAATVPIGRPIANTRVYVLDAAGGPTPIGVPGELHLGGVQVARGYLNRPALTAEKFVPDPFSPTPGARLYRTGDRARWRADGAVEFLGRLDFQVKVRGFRIELGEIETALAELPEVRECAVVALDEGADKRLVAYVVAADAAPPSVRALRDALARRLPDYMVPGAFVFLDALPLNPNGKLDRRALPAPGAAEGREFTAPRTPVEEVVAAVWAEVLKVERVGVDDDFFALGGHSLRATQVVSRVQEALGMELPLRALFESPTVAGVSERLEALRRARAGTPLPEVAGAGPRPLPRTAGRADAFPVSFTQQRLWFLDRMEGSSAAYGITGALRLAGPLDAEALRRALEEAVHRHESLRTTFAVQDGEPVQVIHPPAEFELPAAEFADADEAALRARLDAEARRPFDLAAGPLFRPLLLRLRPDEHVLVLSMHHVISDGWSLGVLLREFSALYGAFRRGEPSPLAERPLQYADYAVWQRETLRGPVMERHLAWWRGQLSGAPALLELPTDRPRPPALSFRGARERLRLPAGTVAALGALARGEGASLFMAVLALWQALLSKYSGQDDVVVGTPIAGRTRAELEGVIGFFANTLALRGDLSGDPSFRTLLGRVREATFGAYTHQEVPFEQVVEEVHTGRSLGHNPLFQAFLALQNASDDALRLDGLAVSPVELESGSAKFDVSLLLREADGEIYGWLEYATDLFDASTIARMRRHLGVLADAVAADPDRPLSRIPILPEDERDTVVREWNATDAVLSGPETIHGSFEAQAARTPDRIAVAFEGERVTYAELDARANQLARHLKRLGVGPEVRVGLCLERSTEMVVALLGVMKAGGAYVPLDPEYPADRLAYMLEDSSVGVLLTQAALRGILPPHRAATVELDAGWDAVAAESAEPIEGGATPRTLAYVIYTSGSTGRPKGVMNAHHAVCNRLRWMLEWGGVRQDDRVLQKTPYSFDVSVWEFFCPLLCGATLVVARPGGHRHPSYLADLIQAERITVAHFVPSMLQLFLDEPGLEERCASLRLVGCSGEALPPALQERFLARMKAELHNLYGPTEAAVEVTHWVCRHEPGAATVPIGRPIANTRVYVLDAAGGPTPIGVPGELHLGGVQVARGYLNRPALTAEKFVPDPFSPTPGARLYRTGDRARWRADGAVEFLGRLDFQVKIRGFRIELGEIETALAELPEVRECVVVALEQRLVAYVVAADAAPPSVRALRDALARRLPDYMVPGTFVFLDALPLNPNGKLDRRALPAPETARADGDGYVAPATPVEEVMAEVWAAVLGVERVGAEDDFFALGGHSLSATRVAARLQQVLGVALPLRSFFESPTVAGMARVAERLLRDGAEEGTPPIVALQAETAPLSFAQRRLWFLERMEPGTGAYNVPAAFRLGGTLEVDALRRALAEVVRRHQVLRSTMDMVDGEPVQRVSAAGEWVLPVEQVDDAALGGRIAAEGWRPFDLERGPLFRAHLFRVAADDHVLLLVMHHVVSDGWSYGVLMHEVSTLYAAFGRGEASPLPPLAVQYADYAAWQRTYVSGEVLERQLAWWKARLAGAPAVLELPTDRPRTALAGHAAADVRFSLPAELAAELRALSRREGATLFMTLLAAWQVLLARYSGQDDVVVGSPIAGRARPEVEGLVGCFVNTLALRGDLSGDPGFRALLARVREDMLGAHAHQDLPFETLVEELAPERSLLHTPLFQVLFTLQKPERAPRLEGLALEMVPTGVEAAKFDLVLSMRDDGQRLQGRISYRTALFDESTAERMAEHLRVLLEGAMAAPELPVSRLPLLAADERRVVVDAWSATERPYGLRRPVHALIEAQAARTPDATAVVHEGDSLTYAELERGANRLAHHLVARGVRPDAPVGLFIERGIGLPAAVLGILKAGGAYVALDPQAPDERLRYVLHDAGARVVVSQRALAARLDGYEGTIVCLDDDADRIARRSDAAPDIRVDADNLAYVIYTSGSTGAPKGVLVRHGGVANYLAWFGETVLGEDGFALPMVSRLSFDAHVRQLYPPLLRGDPVWVLPEETVSDAAALLAELRSRDRVSFGGVPSLWAAIVERIRAGDAAPTGLRAVLLGGETLPAALLERTRALLPGVAVWNHYGPTETTVNTSVARVEEGRVTIGRPIANVQVRLLDAALQPVPIGVPGELYAGGAGVARGYLGRPALTAEKFVPDPFSTEPGARMYRSGDRVRWLADGTLEYLGRADGQVKVRGFRIELGEIESVLARHPAVRESAVTARADEGDDARLVAYVAAREGADASIAELRAHLAASLPGYMVPAAFVFLDRLPLTSSGKVDRRALPAPGPAAPADGADDASYVAPRTQVEEVLAGIWAEVLGVPRVGVDDDFFALGGHSLRAMQVAARVQEVLRVTVPLRALFESPTVAGVALHVERLLRDGDEEGDAPPPLVRVEGGGAPLSFAQRRLWFLERMEPGTATYNIPAALRLEGELDVDALHRALAEIVRRHQGLRTTFADAGGEPVQRVSPAAGLALPVTDAADEAEARRRVMEEAARPFDLEHGPLFRAHLFRVSPEDHVLLLAMHHVVSDGWSSGVLLRELTALYDAFSRGAPSPLAELPVQYADYAAWQRAYLAGGVLQKQLAWWKERLAGAPAVLELPTDRPRPAARSNRGSYERFHLPAELADALRELSRKEGATLFMTLLAAWQALLGRYAGQDDVVVGAPIAGRTHREVEGLIGFFVNTLALRGDLSGDPTFRQLLARVRETTLGAYARQDLPFEKLVEEVAPARSLSHTPLFQTVFALDNTPARSLRLGSLRISRVAADPETSKFDLSLLMRDSGTALTGVLGYSTDLFDAATVRRAAHHLRVLLRAAAAAPDLPLSALSLVDEDEARVLRGWSGAPAEAAPPARCVHHLFEEQAGKTPEATALVYGDQRITYGELDRRANRLAHHLRGRGVGPDIKVGFCMERSPEMVVALLGILKAGGAYVPIDPAYPEERIAFMVREVDAPLLLTQERVLPRLPAGARALALDAAWAQVEREPDTAPDVDVTPDHLVYVLYTSGSTGTPKGSEVAHRALPGFFRGADYVRYDAEQVLLQYSSTSWDVLTLEMWPALLTGATCVLYPAQTVELDGLAAEVRRHGVTTLWFSAAFFNLVIDTRPEVLAGVRQVMVGGEAVSVPHVRRAMELYPALRLVNGYGPSECTVFTSCHVIPRDFGGAAVPIGTPVGDRRVHVLDARMQPVPVGVPGELFVGGPAVPRGYLRRPALTARTLVPDPFGPPGGRLYRTGDRVRWRADGVLEYLGRIDQQVKVRGFRIELEEVEAVLLRSPAVREAVAVVREDTPGDRRLVAYAVAADPAAAPTPAELREHLRTRLPDYMLPSAFVVLDALPLNANRKVDRRALPAPEGAGADEGYVAPRTPTETTLAGIFAEVLNHERVGVHDDFFASGGHSLKATQVVSRAQDVFGVRVPLRALFEHPSVGALAGEVDRLLVQGRTMEVARIVPASRQARRAVLADLTPPGE